MPAPLTLSPNWQTLNKTHSLTSINSTATFHSAFNEMEQIHPTISPVAPKYPSTASHKHQLSIEAVPMTRSDSGYEETSPVRRSTSTSSSRRPRHSSSASRPSAKRASKSTPNNARYSGSRPVLQSRFTNPRPGTSTTNPPAAYQFFQFPSLVDPSTTSTNPSTDATSALRPQAPQHTQSLPPPSTPLYWTSSETRRLEYAAIDAASKGVRGFVTRLMPDCILPKDFRRTRFSNDADADDDDTGSVRRYRLRLPEDKSSTFGGRLEMRECGDDDGGSVLKGRKRGSFLGRLWKK